MRVSFVVPLYNAQNAMNELFRKIHALPYNKEIIFINDGSIDNTDAIAKKLSIRYKKLDKNYGQQYALLTGIKMATGDIVVCLDDDLQTPPEESKKLINALKDFDVVYGFWDYAFGTWIHNALASFFGKPKQVTITSFFAMKKSVVHKINDTSPQFLPAAILRITKNIGSVRVDHVQRKYGKTGYTWIKLLRLSLSGLRAYLHPPLM